MPGYGIDQDSRVQIRQELTPGETILWAGRPSLRPVFIRNEQPEVLLVGYFAGIFGLLWEGLAIWHFVSFPTELGSIAMVVSGLFFAVVSQYYAWGRFVSATRKKKRTYYAVTNRRVIAVEKGSKRKVAAAEIGSIQTLLKEKRLGDIGTLRFAPRPELNARTLAEMFSYEHGLERMEAWHPMSLRKGPVFVDIERVESVYQLVSAIQTRSTEEAVTDMLRKRGINTQG